MPDSPIFSVRQAWKSLTPTGRVAAASIPVFAVAELLHAVGINVPGMGLIQSYFAWALFYWVFIYGVGWARRNLLWGLRNRLLVAYVFIAVVPIILLLGIVGTSAYILYGQLGSYVLSQEVQRTLDRMESLAEAMVSVPPMNVVQSPQARSLSDQVPAAAREALDIPGLEIHPQEGAELIAESTPEITRRFEGLVQRGDQLWLESVVVRKAGDQRRFVRVSARITPELLDSLPLELGPIQWNLVRPERPSDRGQKALLPAATEDSRQNFVRVSGVSSQKRTLPPPAHWLDYEIYGIATFEAVSVDPQVKRGVKVPILASFYARPSRLNHVIFASLGDLSSVPFILLFSVGALFLVIEAAALVTGVVLTRTITSSVDDLYRATQRVKSGDLSHRIRRIRNDQLGALAGSFNEMTASVAKAIEEQRQRERLENELSIAREVQNQLFPRTVPRVPGMRLVASCRAARMVSGDYYDFITVGDSELAFIVADIAGKGISAALLMASLQSALRSQIVDTKSVGSTAEVIRRLNHQLVATTPEDRFATLFFAIFNSQTRLLRYTNAGHLPPIYLSPSGVKSLDVGGTIVGMFKECEYEQGELTLEPGSLIAAYTDGISEPENAYGEQFGRQRIIDVIQRNRTQRPEAILDAIVASVESWAGTPEQADDMTVMLASVG